VKVGGMPSGRSERFEVIGRCINSDKKSVSVLDCNLRFVNCNDILDIQKSHQLVGPRTA
jgi:hypothetical protein